MAKNLQYILEMENKMIREFNIENIENNELVTREGSPLIEITHFNDENEIKKKETYSVDHFLKEAKELKKISYS